MPRTSRRTGFTLVELLVVAGAVSVMGTQLLQAITEAREAARRATCQNNLKQLGLALHNYETSVKVLPPGWVGADLKPAQPNVFGGNGWGWNVMIAPNVAPNMEQATLYSSIDFTVSLTDAKNVAISSKTFVGARTQSPPLRCVSDPYTKKSWPLKDADGATVAEVGTSNYVASFGTGDIIQCEKMKPGEVCAGDGLFFHNSSVRFQNITDGTSNTLAIGERAIDEKSDRMTTWTGVFPKAKSPFSRILGTSDQELNAKKKNASGYDSHHKGGSHFTMMDGSVRFIKSDLDLKVFQALTTRAGGEEIPGDF